MDLSVYKKVKYPLVFLKRLSEQEINEKLMYETLKYFLRFYQQKLYGYKIGDLFDNMDDKYKKVKLLANGYDMLYNENMKYFLKLEKYGKKINRRLLYSSLDNNINYWQNKYVKINAINDSSFGNGFHLRILSDSGKVLKNIKENIVESETEQVIKTKNYNYTNEMINRLCDIKEVLGTSFFSKNDIKMFTIKLFESLDYELQKKIYLKMFVKIMNVIKKDLDNLIECKKYHKLLLKILN